MSALRASVLALAVLMVAGCAEQTTDCPRSHPCDTARRSCQRQTLRVAACLRGTDEVPRVTVDVYDKQTFIDEATAGTAATPIDRHQLLLRRGYALFWLSPWQITDVATQRQQLNNTAAFYDGWADRIVIFRDGEEVDPFASQILLHEYVHALQDLDPLVNALEVDSTESFLVARALIEGEATLLETIARAESAGYALDDVELERALNGEVRASRSNAGRSANLMADAYWTFTYAEGAAFLYPEWRRDGARGLQRVWQHPPRTTREIVARRQGEGAEDISLVEGPRLGPAYRLVQKDALGQWYFQRYLDILRNQGCPIGDHAIDTTADRFSIWQDVREGTIVAAWRVRFADGVLPPLFAFDAGADAAGPPPAPDLVAELQLCFARQLNVVFARDARDLFIAAGDRPDRAPVVAGWGPIEVATACRPGDATRTGRADETSSLAGNCPPLFTLPR